MAEVFYILGMACLCMPRSITDNLENQMLKINII